MQQIIQNAIRELGTPLTLYKGALSFTGAGVLSPVRNLQRADGGISHQGGARTEPVRYYLYAEPALLEAAERGDTVSDGKNEYYVLWKDAYSCPYGSYYKAAVRAVS